MQRNKALYLWFFMPNQDINQLLGKVDQKLTHERSQEASARWFLGKNELDSCFNGFNLKSATPELKLSV